MTTPAARMRVGDAERAAAADRLARHFSHGRLDQDELDDRLDRVMRATTAGDLTEVFADLPADEPVAPAAAPPRPAAAGRRQPARGRRRRGQAVIVLALCIIAAISVAHALAHSIVLLAVVGLIAVLWLRGRRVRDRGSPPSTP